MIYPIDSHWLIDQLRRVNQLTSTEWMHTFSKSIIQIEQIHSDWGQVHAKLKENEEALSNFQKKLTIQAVSLPPDHLDLAKTHTIIGRILSQLQKFTEALANYECALKILFQSLLWANLAKDQASIKSHNSSLTDICALIGDGHWEKGNFSEALQNYQLAFGCPTRMYITKFV